MVILTSNLAEHKYSVHTVSLTRTTKVIHLLPIPLHTANDDIDYIENKLSELHIKYTKES